MTDIETLKSEHARLTAWLKDNALELAGTPHYREAILLHRTATDMLKQRNP